VFTGTSISFTTVTPQPSQQQIGVAHMLAMITLLKRE
jgi:hypothetical protein